METVQQQRLQLKMKFLLGYNKKIVDLWGGGGGGLVPCGGRLSKAFAHDGILIK